MIRILPSFGTLVVAVLASSNFCVAADVQVTVFDHLSKPVSGVVLIATSDTPAAPLASARVNALPAKQTMDQLNKEFVPEVLVVHTGTQVSFPNTDSVAHQVYSFSPAKRFALPLYRGRQHPPVVFEQAGTVTLGCNIHDHMVGYIVVTDSPYYGQSDRDGSSVLRELPPGSYRISAWHPRMSEKLAEQVVDLGSQDAAVSFRLSKPLQPRRAPADRRVRDY